MDWNAINKANDSLIEKLRPPKKQKVQLAAGMSHRECVEQELLRVHQNLRENYSDAGLSAIEVEVSLYTISFFVCYC